ncbi:hypothetical protein BH10ACI1_BH10ACI1_02900 [soil metagenome]
MKFDNGISKKYRQSVEEAFQTILEKGNDEHRRVMKAIIDSDITICVHPVSMVNASGITGVINPEQTNERITSERLSLRAALGEVYITIAKETIDTGFQRGCEGTFVHEGRHAFDFAQTIESFSNLDINPLSLFDPTLYELEWEAHRVSAEYLLRMARDEYLQEGVDLMILNLHEGIHAVSPEGIKRRLRESYGLIENENQGATVSEMFGLVQRYNL